MNDTPTSGGSTPTPTSLTIPEIQGSGAVSPHVAEEVHEGSFRVSVSDPEGSVLEDWSAHDDTYQDGRLGFYVFSLGPNDFNGLTWRSVPKECSTVL